MLIGRQLLFDKRLMDFGSTLRLMHRCWCRLHMGDEMMHIVLACLAQMHDVACPVAPTAAAVARLILVWRLNGFAGRAQLLLGPELYIFLAITIATALLPHIVALPDVPQYLYLGQILQPRRCLWSLQEFKEM